MERSNDRNRPAITGRGEGGGAGAVSLCWNASTTSGLPRTTQAQMPKTTPIGQASDHGTMAAMAAVATSGNQRSRRIMTPPIIIKMDSGMTSTAAEVTVGQNQ